MKNLLPLLVLVAVSTIFAKCKKEEATDDKLYFRVKINGADYVPSNCANCLDAQILGDTIFLLGANSGFASVGFGILDKLGIRINQYPLDDNLNHRGDYKNGTLTNDRYFTDQNHTGRLFITEKNVGTKTIKGTFYFRAYNAYRNNEVNVTEGAFHLNYTTN